MLVNCQYLQSVCARRKRMKQKVRSLTPKQYKPKPKPKPKSKPRPKDESRAITFDRDLPDRTTVYFIGYAPVLGPGPLQTPTDVNVPNGPAQGTVPLGNETSFWTSLQLGYNERQKMASAADQLGSHLTGFDPSGRYDLSSRLASLPTAGSDPSTMSGGILVKNEGKVIGPEAKYVNVYMTWVGGLSTDTNAILYWVVNSVGEMINPAGRPYIICPNTKLNTALWPNAIKLNCDAKGQWDSVDTQTVTYFQLIREPQNTVTISDFGLYVNPGWEDPDGPPLMDFLNGDRLIFAVVNYQGQPFTAETLTNLANMRFAFSGTLDASSSLGQITILNDDSIAPFATSAESAPNNAHFSATVFTGDPYNGNWPVSFGVTKVSIVGVEDRRFDGGSDADFQDGVFILFARRKNEL